MFFSAYIDRCLAQFLISNKQWYYARIITMNEILRPTLSVIITESVLYNEFIWEKIASGHDKMFRMHFR